MDGARLKANNALAFDEAFFQDFFVTEPQIGDVGGSEAEDIFERAAHLAEMKIHADALEQFDEFLCAHGFNRLRTDAALGHPVKRHYVNGLRAGPMPMNVEETPGFWLGRGEPRCHS